MSRLFIHKGGGNRRLVYVLYSFKDDVIHNGKNKQREIKKRRANWHIGHATKKQIFFPFGQKIGVQNKS